MKQSLRHRQTQQRKKIFEHALPSITEEQKTLNLSMDTSEQNMSNAPPQLELSQSPLNSEMGSMNRVVCTLSKHIIPTVNKPPLNLYSPTRVRLRTIGLVSNLYAIQCKPSRAQQECTKDDLRRLSELLLQNEARMGEIAAKQHRFHVCSLRRINEMHEDFTQTCNSLARELQFCLGQIDQATVHTNKTDRRVTVLLNTLSSIQESLRITRLRQENIQLEIRPQKLDFSDISSVKSKHSSSLRPEEQTISSWSNPKLLDKPQVISLETFEANEKQEQFPMKYSQTEVGTVFMGGPGQEAMEMQTRSPFEANFLINNKKNARESRVISGQFSFQRVPEKKRYEKVVEVLANQHHPRPLECWLDSMCCLRRTNASYLLDERGNTLTTSSVLFKQLVEQGYLKFAPPK